MKPLHSKQTKIQTLDELANFVDYSLLESLNCDPDATTSGIDYAPRQVFSGHYVPVMPSAIENPMYIAHSKSFFKELGFAESLATSPAFMKFFFREHFRVTSLFEASWLGNRVCSFHLWHRVLSAVPFSHWQWLWRWTCYLYT